MKLLTDWGFSWAGWRDGQRGEYWVVAQGILLFALLFVPVYRPVKLSLPIFWQYAIWAIALFIAGLAIGLLGKGLLDLGTNLTPLPHPKDDGQLVQTGVYGLVRHPIYSGLTLAVLSWAIFQVSLSHLLAAIVLFAFFNAKASREEQWLVQKYSDYANYREHVKKLIPWIY
jgi:protein-S-isoprenylcysteine O-methyltransferase Ste14